MFVSVGITCNLGRHILCEHCRGGSFLCMGSEKFSHPHTNEIVVWLAILLWGIVLIRFLSNR